MKRILSKHKLEQIFQLGSEEHPVHGILRNLLYGVLLGAVLGLFQTISGELNRAEITGYLVIGNGITFFGWGADRIWFFTAAKMMKNPFSWAAYLTRVPFWCIAGGIGYTLGILLSKKFGLLEVYDIPIKPLFTSGGEIEIAAQVLLQMAAYLFLVRNTPSRTTM